MFRTLFPIISILVAFSVAVDVPVWSGNVNIRSCPGTSCNPPIGNLGEPGDYNAICQQEGEELSAAGYTNNFWTKLSNLPGGLSEGWVTNIYINGDSMIEGIPICGNETQTGTNATSEEETDDFGLQQAGISSSDDDPEEELADDDQLLFDEAEGVL